MEDLIRLIPLVASVFTIRKIFFEFRKGKKNMRIEEYNFTRNFINDIRSKDELHQLIIEKGSLVLCGKYLSVRELRHLIEMPNPSNSLMDYGSAKKFVCYDFENSRVDFKDPYKRERARVFKKRKFFVEYFIWSSIAIGPALLYPRIFSSSIDFKLYYLLVALSAGYFAYGCLRDSSSLARAEEITEKSKKLSGQILHSKYLEKSRMI